MYTLDSYGQMIEDRRRTDAYEAALRAVMRPGCVVLDIGTGPGILACLARRLGARRVFAIEPNPVVQLAREIAAANGMGDAIEFFDGWSTEVDLPERADVIVSDLRGILPLQASHLPAIIDARQRFLAPGGVLVPRSDRLVAGLVASPRLHRAILHPWRENRFGLDMTPACEVAANTFLRVEVRPEELAAPPVECGVFDYYRVSSPHFETAIEFTAGRSTEAHGFALWFEADLAAGIGFSTSPSSHELVYGQALFRWPRAVPLSAGARVRVELEARLVDDEYVWNWETAAGEGDGRVGFRQSTFLGTPLTPEALRKRSQAHVPTLTRDGEIDRAILDLMSKRSPLGEIARDIARRFPGRFADEREALRRVGELSSKYSA